MVIAKGASAAAEQQLDDEEFVTQSNEKEMALDSDMDMDTDPDLDFGELDELKKEESLVSVGSLEEVSNEILDEHDGWLFESTVTNLPLIDLSDGKPSQAKEPGWRVLERKREEKDLADSLNEDLFLDE